MGGSAGHMAHPFDCREVRNGRDLINFYVKAVNSIPLYQGELSRDEWLADFGGVNPSSVKFDGVNASFRLEKTNTSAGFMFVHDRGAKSDKSPAGQIDYKGITPDNAHERWSAPGHGMPYVVKIMSKILNHDLMKVKPYIEALGIFENGIGPEGVTFNAEFYSNEDKEKDVRSIKNVTKYNQNFIAIHNLQDFVTEEKISARGKVTTSRKTRGYYWQAQEELQQLFDQKDQLQSLEQDTSEVDALIAEKNQDLYRRKNEHQQIINKFAEALAENANALDLDFKVHTQVGLQFKEGLTREMVLSSIKEALNQDLSYNYKKIDDNMSVGPVKINEQTGETEPRTLYEFLLAVDQNPAHIAYYPEEFKKTKSDGSRAPSEADIKVKEEFSQRHANKKGKPLSTKQSAFAKKIYDDIIVTGPKTGIGVADVAADDISFKAVNNAVILWEAVRVIGQTLKESVLSKEDFGLPMSGQEGVVIASEKICDGIPFKFTGDFITEGGASQFRQDAPKPVNEAKFRYGEILESFMVEAEMTKFENHVILLPGGFKPPTGGHYGMIKHYEEQPDVTKVIIVSGHKEREGVTYQQSRAIFDIYGGFSDKVQFLESKDATPLLTCYELMKNKEFIAQHPGMAFSLGAGDKGKDPKRIQEFVSYFEQRPELSDAILVAYSPAPSCEVDACPASASRMRKAFKEGDWELFKKLLPADHFYDNVIHVLNGQAGQDPSIAFSPEEGEQVNENFFMTDYLFSLVDEVLSENKQPFNKKEGFKIIIEGREFNKTEFMNTYGRDEAMSNLVNGIITYIPDLQKIPEENRNNEILIPFLDLLADKISNIEKLEAAAAEKVAGAVTAEVSTAVGLQGPVSSAKGGKKMISHEELLAEFKLRRLIRKAIKIRKIRKKDELIKEQQDEIKLRKVIRSLIQEGDIDADTKPAPYDSTPINMLADAFNQILPIVKSGLRKLAKPEERLSYRTHILDKIQKTFNSFDALDLKQGDEAPAIGEDDLGGVEKEVDLEIDYLIKPSDGSEDKRFEPEEVDTETKLEQDFEGFKIQELNPTGARVAFETLNDSNVEETLADKRRTLFDEDDKDQFEFFGMYNLDLWLIAYEEELAKELGQQPAFANPAIEKPEGAQEIGKGAEITRGAELGMSEEGRSEAEAGIPEEEGGEGALF